MILDNILAHKLKELARTMSQLPLNELKARVADASPPRSFAAALRKPEHVAIIAEHKRASPSKGVIRADLDLQTVIQAYEQGGAAAISVLTEWEFFLGRKEDLVAARQLSSVPLLRKDFIIDPYQIWEARYLGADAVLLIAAALSDDRLVELLGLTRKLGMEALVEAHTAEELNRAVAAGAKVIGINNRDLRTFNTDLKTTVRLAPQVPGDRVLVSESGVHAEADIYRLAAAGVDAVLVGETLMRAPEPQQAVARLAGCHRSPIANRKVGVKICGIRSLADGVAAARAGADMLGVIFAPSPRRVSVEFAAALKRELQALPVELVGVFVNANPEDVLKVVSSVGLDWVQLHGDESPQIISHLIELRDRLARAVGSSRNGASLSAASRKEPFKIIKALSVRDRTAIDHIAAYEGLVDAVLLDAPPGREARGGTGTVFDWSLAREARRRYPRLHLGLAGGLRSENVRAAIDAVGCDFVDVSSGVEVPGTPGTKDLQQVQNFIRQAQTREMHMLREEAIS